MIIGAGAVMGRDDQIGEDGAETVLCVSGEVLAIADHDSG